ncbi:MAG: hypothetical protein P8Q36_10245 [Alphaproteobacteria bacterium]|nr:hypothetical protein [Rhodospirillaceae bacterium]MBT6509030.1 hypothetical protein [Rhodospirillaceae bacterium]MDG2481229.1 hypothetical protein [Alphaproteobacteria bacterium]
MSDPDIALEEARSLRLPPVVNDRSTDLASLHDGNALDVEFIDQRFAEATDHLQSVRFLIVPGYLTDFLIVPQSIGLMDQFGGQIAALRDAGFDVAVVDIDSEATVAQSSEVLRAAVAADERPVCLISHSKGGLDTLDFLIHAGPETREKFVCWVALQAPFAGSPIADGVASQDLLRWPSEVALELFGDDGQSLHDHRMDVRGAYLDENAEEIAEIVA